METGLAYSLAVILLASTVVGSVALVSSAPAARATSADCTEVEHNLRTSSAVDAVNQSGEAVSKVSNTEVRVRDTTGFVKLDAKNPNGYCVSYTVEIAPAIVSPADLGEVESNDEETSASWRAAQNLSSGDVYTRVTFTLGAGENATFAPSTVRVESLSWTGEAKNKSSGILSSLSSFDPFGSEKLEQRKYTISPDNASRITVPLTDGNGSEIEEWYATYTVNGETRPVTQDASEPVYYSESSSSVTFHFSDEAVQNGAEVEFTADPTFTDSISHSARSWLSGASEISDWIPGTVAPRGVAT